MGFNDISDNLSRNMDGQVSIHSNANGSSKTIHLAKVQDNSDFSNMGRIRAEIIEFDNETGDVSPGLDKDIVEYQIAYPLIPSFLNVIPQPEELVYIFCENPSNKSSIRFYIGPIRSVNRPVSELETAFSANDLFNIKSYSGQNTYLNPGNSSNQINKDNIYIKGKNDSDIIFRSREVLIRAGSFNRNSFEENILTPCYIQLIQNDNTETNSFSQTNIVGSNINLISSDITNRRIRALDSEGNLVDSSNIENNTNPILDNYGSTAKELHPLVLGDELVKVLKTLIKFCLNHKHTPQENAYAPTEEIGILNDFLSDQNIEFILSKSVRTS